LNRPTRFLAPPTQPRSKCDHDHQGASDRDCGGTARRRSERLVMKNIDLNLPTFGFVVMTRALLGMGIGLLVANRLSPEQRRAVGLTLVGVGAATTIPAALAVFGSKTQKALAA
jgi:hypothetical protein